MDTFENNDIVNDNHALSKLFVLLMMTEFHTSFQNPFVVMMRLILIIVVAKVEPFVLPVHMYRPYVRFACQEVFCVCDDVIRVFQSSRTTGFDQ